MANHSSNVCYFKSIFGKNIESIQEWTQELFNNYKIKETLETNETTIAYEVSKELNFKYY